MVTERLSLDGVFDAGTMDQWSVPYHSEAVGEALKVGILGSDIYLLGRATYEMLAPYWSSQTENTLGIEDKLNSMAKVVVSSTLDKADWNHSTLIKDNAVEEITRLKAQAGQDILIHGSATLVQSLMAANLIDEYQLIVFPTIVGSGKHFFQDGMHTAGLKLIESKPLGKGVVLLRYQPAN